MGPRHEAANLDDPIKGDIPTRYMAGESENAIAKSLGVSRQVIRRRLWEACVGTRGRGDANRLMMAERTPEENLRNTQAAHDAVRGKPVSLERQCRKALTIQALGRMSPYENKIATWLTERGVEFVPQFAIGPYNIDLAISPAALYPVAVEIFGGNWHASGRHYARFPERVRYLFDQGWQLVIVWVSAPLEPALADYLTALYEAAQRDEPVSGQYRVVRGTGEDVTVPGLDLHQLSLVPPIGRSQRARP